MNLLINIVKVLTKSFRENINPNKKITVSRSEDSKSFFIIFVIDYRD